MSISVSSATHQGGSASFVSGYSQKNKGDNRGTILILSLWIVILISLLALSIALRTRLENKIHDYQRVLGPLPYAPLSDLHRVRLILASDQSKTDSQASVWYGEHLTSALKVLKNTEARAEAARVSEGEFRVEIHDEQSKMDLNRVPPEVLEPFFKQLESYDRVRLSSRSEDWIGGILYWRGGSWIRKRAKSGVYYKKAAFESVKELLMIPGIEKQDVKKLEPYFTVFSSELVFKVNINTAPLSVLRAIVESVSGDHFAREKIWDKILELRNSQKTSEAGQPPFFPDDIVTQQAFLQKLMVSTTVQQLDFAARLIPFFTVQSAYFTVKILPSSPEIKGYGFEAVIGPSFPSSWNAQSSEPGSGNYQILSWQRI